MFSTLANHTLCYKDDLVFYSKFLLELAHNFFKYMRNNEATISNLIDFSKIVPAYDCLERLGLLYSSGLHKDEALGNDFFLKVVDSLERELQEQTLIPENVNLYLRLLNSSPDDKKSVLAKNKGVLIDKTNNIVETLDVMGDEYRNDPEIVLRVENRIKDLAEQLISECGIISLNDSIREWIEILLKGIEKNEKANLADLRLIGNGSYSKAFQLGEKVIKIGQNNKVFELPKNSKRLLQPIVRMEIDDSHFEITERVIPIKKGDITEEELYNVYRDLRDDGLCLVDFKPDNFGRLIKPNEIYVDAIKETGGKPKRSFGPNIGIKKDEDVEVLGPGELVLLDLDYIYSYSYWKAEKKKSSFFCNELLERFDDRYEREKKAERDEI